MANPSKIKVAHLVSDLSIGGIQKVVLDICSSADLEKYEVSIYSLNNKTDLLSTYSISPLIKIKTYSYQYSDDYSLLGYFKQAFFKKIISKKSKEIISDIITSKPDILHVHIHPKELNLGIIIEQQIKCKLIYTEHLVRLTPPTLSLHILGIIFRFTYRKYHLIAVSQSALDEIKKHKLLGKNKTLTLIENKLNLNLFKLTQKQAKDYVSVVYVARIGFPKGHEELIHAWSKLLNEPTKKKLFLVGPDGMNNEMQQLAKKIVPDESVVFMGPQYKIAAILNECDFAVFPSFKEGLPIALLEKMTMELPVIVSDIPELTNIIQDSVNGLVFKCGDVDNLAKKIIILLQNPELRVRLGKNARKTIIDRFGSPNIALPNEKVYEKVMKCS